MKVAFYMNCVSTHQLPLAKEVDALVDEFTYVYEGEGDQAYQRVDDVGDIVVKKIGVESRCRAELEDSDLLLSGLRDLELFERRAKKGLKTFYTSERWFKPPLGRFRMLVPGYRRMVKRFVAWVNTDPGARVLAIGPWAKRDFLRMGVKLDKIVDWGYYVEPSHALPAEKADGSLRLLWCGRLLGWKRVGDIVRAVGEHVGLKRVGISLTIVGDGSEKDRLMEMAATIPGVTFLPSQSPEKIRELMRQHDTFVLASNGYEGWGAVVSEALEEGMNVIGTYEAGASAAMLPTDRLYHAGDVKVLARLLEAEYRGELPACSIGEWTAKRAAERLVRI